MSLHRTITIATLSMATALPGCRTLPAETRIDVPPATVTLETGQAVRLPDGARLRYLRLVHDSRCPVDVQCIHAGDAEIELRHQPATGAARFLRLGTAASPLRSAPTTATIDGWELRLERLDRRQPPRATLTLSRSD